MPAREQGGEDLLELPLHVGEGGREDVVDPLVDLADDGEQVAAGGLEVLELGGEEAVPLLQGRELLERQRVDLAEGGEVALGLGRAALLDGAVVGHRIGLGLPRRLGGGDLLRRGRHRGGRPVLGEQRGQVDAVLLGRADLQRLDPVPLLGAGDLVAVHLVGQPVQVRRRRADPGAHLEQLGLERAPGGRERVPLDRGPRRATVASAASAVSASRAHRGGDGRPALPGHARRGRPLAGGALLPGLATQRLGPAVQRAGALLGGADGEPGLGLGLTGRGDLGAQPVALVGGGLLLDRRGLGVGQPLLQAGQRAPAPARAPARPAPGRRGAARPRPRRTGRRPPARRAPWRRPSASGRRPAARRARRRRRRSGRCASSRAAASRSASSRARATAPVSSPSASSTRARTTRLDGASLCPPTAQSAPTRSPAAVTARTRGWVATRATAASRSGTTATRSSARARAGCSSAGASTRSRAQRAPSGSDGQPSRGTGGSPPVTSRPARPPSVSLRWARAAAASATPETTTASAMPPSAAASADSSPGCTVSRSATGTEDAGQVRPRAPPRRRRPG